MKMHARILVLIALFVLTAGAPGTIHAAWIENGNGLCTETDHQLYAEIIRSEDGAYIATWHDKRTDDNFNIWAQKFDVDGNELWTPGGVFVQGDLQLERFPKLVTDGAGGAIIAWEDLRSGVEIYAQRIDAGGNKLWGTYGEPVCTASSDQVHVEMIPDAAGGAIIVWQDHRVSMYTDIYAQRIDGAGTALWTTDGIAICDTADFQYWPAIATDNAGGAIITWYDKRNGTDYNIYATRIDADGDEWAAGNLAVCTASGDQLYPEIAYDGYIGAIITWYDARGASYDIYAQKIHLNGTCQWTADGVAVCTFTDDQEHPRLAADGTGGAIVVWRDFRTGSEYDLYAQRIDQSGATQWTADGVVVCDAAGFQTDPRLVSDGMGGAIVAWQDERVWNPDIYAQRIDASGTMLWTDDGAAICTAANDQNHPVIASDGAAGAIIVWDDWRSGETDVYVQRIERNGYWGYPAPQISGVRDIPGDEGGCVNLSWDASRLDPWPLMEITSYTVWRAIDPTAAMLMIDAGARLVESAAALPISTEPQLSTTPLDRAERPDAPLVRRQDLGTETYYWYLIDTVDPYYLLSYSAPEPTMFDSTATSDEYHYFQVIAHTADPAVFYASEPDSGYSVDNLSPCPPLAFAGEQSFVPEGLKLTWDPNAEPDLDGYAIYRGVGPGFTPGPGNLLTEPCDTFYFDGDWRWDSGYCYKVAALDIHGNESECALLCSDGITGGETPVVPQASFLAQNHPNPFNPATTIRFGLAEPAHVTLRIYDAAGRLVCTLVDGHRAANRYEVTWDGRDGTGRAAASGVYFYKLNAGAFEKTRKMVLLR